MPAVVPVPVALVEFVQHTSDVGVRAPTPCPMASRPTEGNSKTMPNRTGKRPEVVVCVHRGGIS